MSIAAPPASERYLLCVPGGGFADNVKVISKCHDYALRQGRTLVVNTLHGKLQTNFAACFRSVADRQRIVVDYSPALEAQLNRLGCVPSGVAGRLHAVKLVGEWRDGRYVHVDRTSGDLLSFDFGTDHEAPLLYHSWYGEETDFGVLWQLAFSDELRLHIESRLKALPASYQAVHIRCTDKRTDYAAYLEEIRDQLSNESVLVCTDNLDVLRHARSVLGAKRVLNLSTPPDVAGLPLHQPRTIRTYQLDRQALRLDMFSDLIGLACSERLFYPGQATMAGHDKSVSHAVGASGFSELAAYLKAHPALLRQLLGRGAAAQPARLQALSARPSDDAG